ncbi:MAG: VWA domain-containing protein [Verrucomicrobiaceae bacterium]|nr:MAG: VWA domain-containing protein [Verrucomicrobiaceae bacterium]
MSTPRRLPVFLLLDTSGSMKGEPLESLRVGLQALVSSLRQDPYALESVHLSVITFDREVKELCPLTSLESFQCPVITCPDAGPTHLGAALQVLCATVRREVRATTPERKGDWRPILFVMTDGSPSDLMAFEEALPLVKSVGFASIIACAAGPKARREPLEKFADHVVTLDQMDGSTFASFFKWISSTISSGNRTMGVSSVLPLPPPPSEIHVVI